MSIIFSYPDLPLTEKVELEKRILARPSKYSLPEFEHLLAVGFPYEKWNHLWLERYCELAQFRAQHGHLRVGDDRFSLMRWMVRQRDHRRQEKISPDQQRALNRLEFCWAPEDEKWQKKYEAYRAHVTGKKGQASHRLVAWLNVQRTRWDRLSPKQRQLLSRAGFAQDPFGQRRATNLKEMETYFRKKGHLIGMPVRLRKFSESMRRFQGRGMLDPSYKDRLDRLKFRWLVARRTLDPASLWDQRHAKVAAYLQSRLPHVPPLPEWEDPKLAKWVGWQREMKQWARLSPQQQRQLTELKLAPGMVQSQTWEMKYDEAVSLFKKIGPTTVKHSERIDSSVGRWLRGQKERWATLEPWQREKLCTLGIKAPVSIVSPREKLKPQ